MLNIATDRLLGDSRFGKFKGYIRSLNRTRFKVVQRLQKEMSEDNAPSKCIICEGISFELVSESDRFGLRFNKCICKQCGLLQTCPMPSKEFFNSFYSNTYRELYHGQRTIHINKLLQHQVERGQAIVKYIGHHFDLENVNIFEIGCSYGGVLQAFEDAGLNVEGCDLDEAAIAVANERFDNVYVAELPKSKSVTKTIYILSHVLEHIPNPISFLRTLNKLMSEDDLLYVEVPGILHLLDGGYRGDLLNYFHIGHVAEYNKTTLENVLRLSGFKMLLCDEKAVGMFQKASIEDVRVVNAYPETRTQLLQIEKHYKKT